MRCQLSKSNIIVNRKNKETLSSPGRFGFLTEPAQRVLLILNFTINNKFRFSDFREVPNRRWGFLLGCFPQGFPARQRWAMCLFNTETC